MTSICPICDATIQLTQDVELSEVILCSDCSTQLVVSEKKGEEITLKEAPAVEEDWGE